MTVYVLSVQFYRKKKMIPQPTPQKEDLEREKAPDRPPSPEEVDARSQQRVDANQELLTKNFNLLQENGILSDAEIANFSIPNRKGTIGTLRQEIAEITEKLNATTTQDTEESNAQLEQSRAVAVTELLYYVTGLIKTEMQPKVVQKITELKSVKNETGSLDAQIVAELKAMQKIAPQWEALVTNSTDLIKYFRQTYSESISDSFLGELNEALYLGINKNTENLSIQEKVSGGGVLISEMAEIGSELQRFLAIDLDVLLQKQATVAREDQPESSETVADNKLTDTAIPDGSEVDSGQITAKDDDPGSKKPETENDSGVSTENDSADPLNQLEDLANHS